MPVRCLMSCLLVIAACGADEPGARDAQGDALSDGAATETSLATDTVPAETSAPADSGAPTDAADTGVAADTSAASDTGTTGDTSAPDDTRDAATAPSDTATAPSDTTSPGDTGPSCLALGHAAGERYPAGDHCNFCECLADGSSLCTSRTCPSDVGGCEYDGRPRDYAQRFPATDGCNECVCAASGLACTHRCPELPQEGAILLESMDAPCGDNPAFTGDAVWSNFPHPDLTVPLTYATDGAIYPETLPPTVLRLRVVREATGYVVCRIPSPEQPAIDMEVMIEWITADGAFDEGFHTYLRRNDFGFVDGWFVAIGASALDGTFDPACLDPNGFGFAATYLIDRSVTGDVGKVCETDIMLTVGTFEHTPTD